MKINIKVLNVQKISIGLIILIVLSIKFIEGKIYFPSKTNKKDLQININTASINDLIKVPYIGEKTAKKILKLRDEKGFFNSIYELKNIRNYKKFKNYIKTE